MDIYNAIFRAAGHIEETPGCYSFAKGDHPDEHQGVGCALSWIGYFAGIPRNTERHTEGWQYDNIVCHALTGSFHLRDFFAQTGCGVSDRTVAPSALRAYAARYHAPKPQTLDWKAMASVRTVPEGLRSEELA